MTRFCEEGGNECVYNARVGTASDILKISLTISLRSEDLSSCLPQQKEETHLGIWNVIIVKLHL